MERDVFEMRRLGKLAIIGSGPSGLYLLKHLSDQIGALGGSLDGVVILEKSALAGYGMPYHPETTDRYNRANISSEELPELPEKLASWLKSRDREELLAWGIEKEKISESEVYCRISLGEYFHDQFQKIIAQLRDAGLDVDVRTSCPVEDISDDLEAGYVEVRFDANHSESFDTVVIATGHCWEDDDRPDEGFYSSPWPIFKLLPEEGEYLNFTVGTLGASLSAFDVVSSLSHRHGNFVETETGLTFEAFDGAENFGVSMHSSEGWLPHLQWDQVEPFREIYRHVSRERLLSLRDDRGYLRLNRYFDEVCRPALLDAFEKDGLAEVVALLRDDSFGVEDFVKEMSDRHDYVDSFEGMQKEYSEAKDSVKKHRPIHWKETLDDIMYCLNYHAELMPAEDHILLKKTVMPFLMNVIAAMPLKSARMLLALHDAGKIRLIPGKVEIEGRGSEPGTTRVSIESKHKTEQIEYRMFINCSGQKPMELDDFPFPSLAESGRVREAKASFLNQAGASEVDDDKLINAKGTSKLRTGGVDIDAAYRLICRDGTPNEAIYDLSFPHTSGVRPYSYGLQACSATAGIVVQTWADATRAHRPEKGGIVDVSKVYDEV